MLIRKNLLYSRQIGFTDFIFYLTNIIIHANIF